MPYISDGFISCVFNKKLNDIVGDISATATFFAGLSWQNVFVSNSIFDVGGEAVSPQSSY